MVCGVASDRCDWWSGSWAGVSDKLFCVGVVFGARGDTAHNFVFVAEGDMDGVGISRWDDFEFLEGVR